MYYLVCDGCHKRQRKICKANELASQSCGDCKSHLSRDPEPHPPSSQATEVLDNGIMTKKLERLADAERLFKDRNIAVNKNRTGQS